MAITMKKEVNRKHPLAECEVPLSNGGIAIVDGENYEEVIEFKWYRMDGKRTSYARQTSHRQGKIFLHQFVLNTIEEVDHIDGNGLNNLKTNLRIVTHQQNLFNQKKRNGDYSSKYKGVYWSKTRRKWIAQICKDGKSINLGGFLLEEQAALKYDEVAKEMFGEYSRTNR